MKKTASWATYGEKQGLIPTSESKEFERFMESWLAENGNFIESTPSASEIIKAHVNRLD